MDFDYEINLHCNGKKKDIEKFKNMVKESVEMSEFNPDLSPTSMYIYKEDVEDDIEVEFLPIMENFPGIMFFFEIFEAYNYETTKFCSFIIYRGSKYYGRWYKEFVIHKFEKYDDPWAKLESALKKGQIVLSRALNQWKKDDIIYQEGGVVIFDEEDDGDDDEDDDD